MGSTQSNENKPSPSPNPSHSAPINSHATPIPINIPKSSIPGYSGAHRDAMEVIMSPPASPNSRLSQGIMAGSLPNSTDLIPTVFTWSGGGKSVYIAGSFNDWKEKLPLTLSDKDFTIIRNLPPGIYQYKFIVDGKWLHAQDQPTTTDSKGNVNNLVDVKPAIKQDGLSLSPQNKETGVIPQSGSPPGAYSTVIPDDILFSAPNTTTVALSPTQRSGAKAPIVPGLPPHLQRALLNTAPPSEEDPSLLPLPHHVMLNHLYILPKEGDDVTILGVTHRYKTKFVTTVLYKPFVGLKVGAADDITVEIEL